MHGETVKSSFTLYLDACTLKAFKPITKYKTQFQLLKWSNTEPSLKDEV